MSYYTYAFGTMHTTYKSGVSLFLVVLALEDIRIYVCTLDSCDMASNIKASVNEILGFETTLRIPNVDLDNSYVRFSRDFDNSMIWGKYSIIENMSHLKDSFDYISSNQEVCIFNIVRDAQDFEIQFQLRKSWTHYIT